MLSWAAGNHTPKNEDQYMGGSLNKPSHKLEKRKTGKFYAGEQFKTNGQISHISVAELLWQ